MNRISRFLRTQCRQDLHKPPISAQHIFVRTRTNKPAKRRSFPNKARRDERDEGDSLADAPKISVNQVPDYFSRNVNTWISQYNGKVVDRLIRFGIPKDALRPLLKQYAKAMQDGTVLRDLNHPDDHLARIADDVSSAAAPQLLDRYFTKFLYEWASLPEGQQELERTVSTDIISRMQTLYRAADLSDAGWEYPWARRAHPRKFIMHVGPTNSGKTHNALRALATAKRGMYAGPLRLLAYEIYERLNKGQIVPLGMEADSGTEADPQSNIDDGQDAVKGKNVVVTKTGNPRFARQCNMITGEEKKIVALNAPLLSCTVEMTPITTVWDVAVIDEIQLISDRQRGGAWTAAVLGLNAAEIHLCGEESAIPLVQALVESMGDVIEINRYKRLTPLVVAEKSLEGDLTRVQKGDCAVTFSRTGLFGLKRNIEKAAKIRCALAYGRLPPEIRSEQAALFNDPDSDYNVLVGSDAVGMGLNLKIKRVIFETVHKFDGGRMRPLSDSQIKQIAGRAGRFGLHQGDSIGVATTLHTQDLERVREALAAPSEPLRYARLNMNIHSFTKIVRALPQDATNITVGDVYTYISKMSPLFEFQEASEIEASLRFIDDFQDCLTLNGRLLAQNAPCPWRDNQAAAAAQVMMEIYREKLRVPVEEMLHQGGLLKKLNKALALMEGGTQSSNSNAKEVVDVLGQLETVHKVIVVYLWFSYRYTVAFPEQVKAFELRRLTELAMDWCLEVMHQIRVGAQNPSAEARKSVLERRPTETTDPQSPVELEQQTVFMTPEIIETGGRWQANLVW